MGTKKPRISAGQLGLGDGYLYSSRSISKRLYLGWVRAAALPARLCGEHSGHPFGCGLRLKFAILIVPLPHKLLTATVYTVILKRHGATLGRPPAVHADISEVVVVVTADHPLAPLGRLLFPPVAGLRHCSTMLSVPLKNTTRPPG